MSLWNLSEDEWIDWIDTFSHRSASMPVKVMSSKSILAKYGDKARKAFEAHKGDELDLKDFQDLPPNVNGVARLVECKIDTFKEGDLKGEGFFFVRGIVVEPKEYAGAGTSLMPEPLCDTPNRTRKTTDAHFAHIIQRLKALGLRTEEINSLDDLESAMSALKVCNVGPDGEPCGPYFKFRTWQGKPTTQYPNPRVSHSWGEAFEYNPEEGDSDSYTEDDSPPPEPPKTGTTTVRANGTPAKAKPAVTNPPKATPVKQGTPTKGGTVTTPNGAATKGGKSTLLSSPPKGAVKTPPKKEPPKEDFDEFEGGGEDLDSLAEAADGGDEDAKKRLTELAEAAKLDEDEVGAAENWGAVADMIKAATAPASPSEDEEEGGEGSTEEEASEEESVEEEPVEEFTPETGGVYYYRPLVTNPKTGKKDRAKKAIECETVTVDLKTKTATLKSLNDGKTKYVKVPFDMLLQSEG